MIRMAEENLIKLVVYQKKNKGAILMKDVSTKEMGVTI